MSDATSLKRKRYGAESVEGAASKRARLTASRQQLPIYTKQNDIRSALRTSNILVLSGETGSGKSTQLPQYLLDEPWMAAGTKIAVTQPRRVAAITLAKRVAEEMGTPCGSSSPASKVGYSVRFDESTSPSTRIKFLTEGMLLQEMLRDAEMKQYSCIVVDEVHERSVNVDLILGFLKLLLRKPGRRKQPLRVVVMSATADVESIRAFFASDSSEMVHYGAGQTTRTAGSNDEDNGSHTPRNGSSRDDEGAASSPAQRAASCHVEGRQYPVRLRYLEKPTEDIMDATLENIFKIHCKESMPGDILVFLTGQETIEALQKLVEEYAQSLTRDYPKLLVLPLFAALPQHAQQRIFEHPPPNTRKVILSTNIAETSVTVPGVRFVVDTGKAKIKKFHNRLGLDSLLVKPISKSSADQRKGRAGREAAGECHRLYTQTSYDELEKDNTPEILRCDLADTVLKMKARGVDDILIFPFLTPPPRGALEKALLQLLQLSALRGDGTISALGRKMASLPLTPALGRVIIEAAKVEHASVLEIIDIVSCLSVENIFLNVETEEAREKAQTARSQLFRRQGDHLTLLAAVRAFSEETADRKRWAEDHMVSHRAMKSVMDVRKQLRAQCRISKLLGDVQDGCGNDDGSAISEEMGEKILKCFLRGFWNNIARLCPDGSYKTYIGNQTIGIHPSSVLFGRKVEAIVYNELVYTNKAWARGASAVQIGWVESLFSQADGEEGQG